MARLRDQLGTSRKYAQAFLETVGLLADSAVNATQRSDVRNLVNDAHMEAITFGPGNVAECHCADERVAIDELVDAAEVIATVARRLLL